jgi:hypothetical protein
MEGVPPRTLQECTGKENSPISGALSLRPFLEHWAASAVHGLQGIGFALPLLCLVAVALLDRWGLGRG